MLYRLPVEIIAKISPHLSVTDICRLSMTCRHLNNALLYQKTWHQQMCREFLNCNDKVSTRFAKFLNDMANKYDWQTCYRFLDIVWNKKQSFFWDDATDIMKSKTPFSKLSPNASISLVAKTLVQEFLENKNENITLTLQEVYILALLSATVTEIKIPCLAKTLLEIGSGPYRTGSRMHYTYSTEFINRFYTLRIHEILYRYGLNPKWTVSKFHVDFQLFLSQFRPVYCFERYKDLFGASKEDVEISVLRILFAIVKHYDLSKECLHDILNLTYKSFERRKWLETSQKLQKLLTRSLQLAIDQKLQQPSRLKRTIDLFQQRVPTHITALELTYQDQSHLTSLKLDEYVQCILSDNESQRDNQDEILFFNKSMQHEKRTLSMETLHKLQDNHTEESIINYFREDIRNKLSSTKKVNLINYLLEICEYLHALNNFSSLKNILQGIRSVLSTQSKTGISWSHISYETLKSFVDFEKIFSQADQYDKYNETLNNTRIHCIPKLSIHVQKIQRATTEKRHDLDRKQQERDRERQLRDRELLPVENPWYCFNVPTEYATEIHEIANVYFHFRSK